MLHKDYAGAREAFNRVIPCGNWELLLWGDSLSPGDGVQILHQQMCNHCARIHRCMGFSTEITTRLPSKRSSANVGCNDKPDK